MATDTVEHVSITARIVPEAPAAATHFLILIYFKPSIAVEGLKGLAYIVEAYRMGGIALPAKLRMRKHYDYDGSVLTGVYDVRTQSG